MTKVTAQMSVSLDGYYAGSRHTGEPSEWLKSVEAAGFFRITRWATSAMAWRERQGFAGGEKDVDSDVIAESFEAAGAYVMGGTWRTEARFPGVTSRRSTRRCSS